MAVSLSGQTLVEDHHTFSGLWSHRECSRSSPAKPAHRNKIKKKEKEKTSLVQMFGGHWKLFFHSQKKEVHSYFDFGFIWSFIGVCHFGPLFLSLSVRLHNATKKGTFVLREKNKTKRNIKYWAIHILLTRTCHYRTGCHTRHTNVHAGGAGVGSPTAENDCNVTTENRQHTAAE